MVIRGWDYVDVILFSGDAYIDHPSFGTTIIGRLLEKKGTPCSYRTTSQLEK